MNDNLLQRLRLREIQRAIDVDEPLFMGVPESWFEPHAIYGCAEGHSSTVVMKTELYGDVCTVCRKPIQIIPHKYNTNELLQAALKEIEESCNE